MLVISDEIFAGLWRLGSASAWERLHIMPDIACYAKLLTGGASPSLAESLQAWLATATAGCWQTDDTFETANTQPSDMQFTGSPLKGRCFQQRMSL